MQDKLENAFVQGVYYVNMFHILKDHTITDGSKTKVGTGIGLFAPKTKYTPTNGHLPVRQESTLLKDEYNLS